MASSLTDKGSTWAWRKTRKRILIRDRHTCQYCGAPANTVDHKLPRRMGGGDEDSNLVACCSSCQHGGDRTTHIGRPMSPEAVAEVVAERRITAPAPASPLRLVGSS